MGLLKLFALGAALVIVTLAAGNNGQVGLAQSQLPQGMVLIPAGSFQMGDSLNEGYPDERPVHTVFVRAFYMDANDVTVGLWNGVVTWAAVHGYDLGPRSGSENPGDKYPVVYISWYEAVKWANARSEMEGLVPAYYTDGSQETIYKTGNIDLSNDVVKWSANGYRLPTEAEWEKAARGGLAGQRYPWGNDIDCTKANYGYDHQYCVGHTNPVGSYPANGYGLHDMAGNVWQWAWDWYDSSYYANSPRAEPRGPASGSGRVGRGGGWLNGASISRVASRLPNSPGFSSDYVGFRLVRTAP
jgi:formylglycine-generating enzyme required for sulfatase activity